MSNWSDDPRSDPPIWVQIPVLPSINVCEGEKDMEKMNWKKIVSILVLACGLLFYVGWSSVYNAWTDIGVYSVSIIFVVLGVLGFLISLSEEKQ